MVWICIKHEKLRYWLIQILLRSKIQVTHANNTNLCVCIIIAELYEQTAHSVGGVKAILVKKDREEAVAFRTPGSLCFPSPIYIFMYLQYLCQRYCIKILYKEIIWLMHFFKVDFSCYSANEQSVHISLLQYYLVRNGLHIIKYKVYTK